jgi:aerobic carbon-monoxide dehydrogenase medium subunit
VIPTAFDYQRATSVDDALAKLGNGGGKLLAGGHSLIPLMKLRLSEPQVLIDISRIKELSGIRQNGGAIEIGAGTVHSEVAGSSLLRDVCPVLAETAAEIGDPQVRNKGTLGGSLAHADPSADYPATMIALDAEIMIRGAQGSRTVKAADFFIDLFTVDLAPNELITGVRFTPVRAAGYAKLHQRASHFAIVGVAAAVSVENGVIKSARVGLTGALSHAVRLSSVEQAMQGKQPSPATVDAVAKVAADGLDGFNADMHASAEYRKSMVAVFTRRALEKALSRA